MPTLAEPVETATATPPAKLQRLTGLTGSPAIQRRRSIGDKESGNDREKIEKRENEEEEEDDKTPPPPPSSCTLGDFFSSLATEERKRADLIFKWFFENRKSSDSTSESISATSQSFPTGQTGLEKGDLDRKIGDLAGKEWKWPKKEKGKEKEGEKKERQRIETLHLLSLFFLLVS